MKIYYFREDGVYLNETETSGPGWDPSATPTSPLPIPEGSYAVWQAPQWTYIVGNPPPYPPPSEVQAENKKIATQLLQQTDWTCTVDINNPQYSNPYLMNQDAFLAYRSTVRAIAVNPPTTPAVFPTMPQEVWSNT
jgi:hypothetical protein